jgi:hypothetical protein
MPDSSPFVCLTLYKPDELDRCVFVATSEVGEKPESGVLPCGQPGLIRFELTDQHGHGAMLKLCRAHVCQMAISLIQQLE